MPQYTQIISRETEKDSQAHFKLPPLPYQYNLLVPAISSETLHYHHDKHHANYVKKLNELLPGSDFEDSTLVEIIKNAEGPLFNNAAQHWNHTFYWHSMTGITSENQISSSFRKIIEDEFVKFSEFQKEFEGRANEIFGSGWAWLVVNEKNKLEILTTKNAESPLRLNLRPLLACDVWEHAYYLDYQNDRVKYLERFWDVVNWQFVEKNFADCQQ